MKVPNKLILASNSPVRQMILKQAGVPFTVRTASVNEASIKENAVKTNTSPIDTVTRLARAKARGVKRADNEIILGADQILLMDGVLYDKPSSLQGLRQRLLDMRGRSHTLLGAQVCLSNEATPWVHISRSVMQVRDFSERWLDAYLAHEGDSVLYCVGGYKFEGRGALLFSKTQGDYYAILGLELLPLMAHLRERGALMA